MVLDAMEMSDLEASAIDYATALRMGSGVSKPAEASLYASLRDLRERLSDVKDLDRGLATLLMELVVTSWGSTPQYSEADRRAVVDSVALISEAAHS